MDKKIIIGEIYYEGSYKPTIDYIEKILKDNGVYIIHKLDSTNSVLVMSHDQLSTETNKYYDSHKGSFSDI